MIKKVIVFRMCSWGIGIVLAIISRFIFSNENGMIWNVTRFYNEIVCVISLVPVVQILLIVDLIRSKKEILMHFAGMIFVLVCFAVYICTWVGVQEEFKKLYINIDICM